MWWIHTQHWRSFQERETSSTRSYGFDIGITGWNSLAGVIQKVRLEDCFNSPFWPWNSGIQNHSWFWTMTTVVSWIFSHLFLSPGVIWESQSFPYLCRSTQAEENVHGKGIYSWLAIILDWNSASHWAVNFLIVWWVKLFIAKQLALQAYSGKHSQFPKC